MRRYNNSVLQITFIGHASSESILLIDSFRYVPRDISNEEDCKIYEDISTTMEYETTYSTQSTISDT